LVALGPAQLRPLIKSIEIGFIKIEKLRSTMIKNRTVKWCMNLSTRGKVAVVFTLLILVGCVSGQQGKSPPDFFKVIGASRESDVRPCADYAASRNYLGNPYYIRIPENGNVITRHEGMDFCSRAGDDVIAPTSGIVVNIVEDNPYRGGSVTLKTFILYDHYGTNNYIYNLHIQALHIMPNKNLSIGSRVIAGDVIGRVQPPNRPEIGPRPHVHLAAGAGVEVWKLHTDPNQFWQKGPGKVSCYNPSKPPSEQQLVAPIRCSVADKN
jgi:hypothetical protein